MAPHQLSSRQYRIHNCTYTYEWPSKVGRKHNRGI